MNLEIVVLVAVLVLAVANVIGWKMWFRERSKAHELGHALKMLQLEMERMAILASAVAVARKSRGNDHETRD